MGSQAAAVSEDVADAHLPSGIWISHAEPWKVIDDSIFQFKFALIGKYLDCRCRERFRVRGDAEHRMHIDGLAIVQIALSGSLFKDDSAVLDHDDGDAGNVELFPRSIDVSGEICVRVVFL